MKLPSLTYVNSLLISAPKIDTDLLWDLSILFVSLASVYFIGVFYFRNRISSNSKKISKRKRSLSPMISEFLFMEEDATKDEKSSYVALKIEIRQLMKDDFNRKVLSEILLDLRKDISGEAQQNLFKLYQDLGLHNDAFEKLRSWRWQIISKGILELTQMEVTEAYSFITKFINDKRSTIRKQAEIATVTLRHEGINYFLDTTKYKISEWQQLKLLDVIRNKEDFQAPRFSAWLTSNNKYVVLFALRLIKYYNQNDACASLVELIKHKNNQIKEEAIGCIKEFNVIESIDTMKLVFWNCSIDVKIAILDTLAEIGSEADIEFLNSIEKKELNFSVRSKALSSINSISPESVMPSNGIQKESRYKVPEDITEAVAQVHAQKHAEITGEKEAGLTDEEFEALSMTHENSDTPKENSVDEIHTPEKEMPTVSSDENSFIIEEIPETSAQELETPLDQIKVSAEELVLDEEHDSNDLKSDVWEPNHLDFLPLVIAEELEIPERVQDTDAKVYPEYFEQEVVFDEVVAAEKYDLTASNENSEFHSLFEEFDISDLKFLPVVVDNGEEKGITLDKKVDDMDIDLHQLQVDFDEVVPEITDESENENEHLDIIPEFELDSKWEQSYFESQNGNSAMKHDSYQQYQTEEIYNTPVSYEEIKAEEKNAFFDIIVNEPPIVSVGKDVKDVEQEFKVELEHNDEIELPIENESIFQKIIDELISFDEKPQEEKVQIDDAYQNPDWDLDEEHIDFIPFSIEKEAEPSDNYIKIEKSANTSEEDEIEIPKASIPRAIFGDIEFEAATRHLLNDLEEMGDQREIPFLKELLAHEKYDRFKVRINNLIDAFNHTHEEDEIDSSIQPFSVFQDLFRTCDTEAKLILLDEVVAVGDEKELPFLIGLIEDDSSEIRAKSIKVLHDLKEKLGLVQDDLEIPLKKNRATYGSEWLAKATDEFQSESPNDPNDIFDLNFDLADNKEEGNNQKKK